MRTCASAQSAVPTFGNVVGARTIVTVVVPELRVPLLQAGPVEILPKLLDELIGKLPRDSVHFLLNGQFYANCTVLHQDFLPW